MRHSTKWLCVLAVAMTGQMVAGQATKPASGPAKPPTRDEIQKMVDAKSYQPALRGIARILPPGKGASAERYALLMMRAECLLQTKDNASAILSLNQAMDAAPSLADDEAARALALLIKKSKDLKYTPRTGGDTTPIDISNLDSRKRAMAQLLTDELPGVAAKANEAVTSKTLPPLLAFVPTFRDMHALEMVGTGDDKQTLAMIQPLGDRVYDIIANELNNLDQQVAAIQRAAARTANWGGGGFTTGANGLQWVPDQGSSGLTADDRQTLRDMIGYLQKIGQTCDDLASAARKYDRDGKRWQDLSKLTATILNAAGSTYDQE